MFFFIPLHLAALALCMYIVARHQADISPIKLAAVFAGPIWILIILHSSVSRAAELPWNPIFLLLPIYFLMTFIGLKLWFYVGFVQSATISLGFIVYIAAFHILFGKALETPPETDGPKSEFITLADEHLPYKGVKVFTSEQSSTLICQITIDRDLLFDEEMASKPGWFVYCESPVSYWIYSGDLELAHLRVTEEGSTTRNSTEDKRLIKSSPSQVRKRMSKEATKDIRQHTKARKANIEKKLAPEAPAVAE